MHGDIHLRTRGSEKPEPNESTEMARLGNTRAILPTQRMTFAFASVEATQRIGVLDQSAAFANRAGRLHLSALARAGPSYQAKYIFDPRFVDKRLQGPYLATNPDD